MEIVYTLHSLRLAFSGIVRASSVFRARWGESGSV